MENGPLDFDAVILDLFGVVIAFDNDIVYRRLAVHCVDPEKAFRRLNGLMADRDVITDKVALPQIHQRLIDEYSLDLAYPAFEEAWLEPYSEPMPGMADVLAMLSANYRLLLLTNVDRYYWAVVRSIHPELDHFDELLLSCDLRIAKPDTEIFRSASEIARAEPHRCFFVDDTRANVDTAAALGFRTHHFQGTAGFVDALRSARAKGF